MEAGRVGKGSQPSAVRSSLIVSGERARFGTCPGHPLGTTWPRNELLSAQWEKERGSHMGLMVWEERMSKAGTGLRGKEQPLHLPTWIGLTPAGCCLPSPHGLRAPGAPGRLFLPRLPLRYTPPRFGPAMPLVLQPHFEAQAQGSMDLERQ